MVTVTVVGTKELQPSNSAHPLYRSPETLPVNWFLFHLLQFPVCSLLSCFSSSFFDSPYISTFHAFSSATPSYRLLFWHSGTAYLSNLCSPLTTKPGISLFPEPLPNHTFAESPVCSPCLQTVSITAQWTLLGELGNLSMICFLAKYSLCCEKEKEII